jgi:pyruvate dehydrogenase E2 component (dihydrolipoamide acetyltransferase)
MPRLSDSMEEATILQWLKRPGDAVAKGEPLVEVETDKATVVYEAEQSGVLAEIAVDEGGTAELGAVIARITVDGGVGVPAAPAAAPPSEPREIRGRPRATPVARRLAEELGVDLSTLVGSGPGGRIVEADVRSATPTSAAAPSPKPTPAGGRGAETEVALTATQRTIAERMAQSRSEIPEFTLEAEIDMEGAAALREDLRELGHEPLPSFNDMIVRAAALALREFPALNSAWRDGQSVRYDRINVGIAVATDDALLVPTIHDADRKSLAEIAETARGLIEKVRAKSIRIDDLQDGTFTISNLGMFGVRRFEAVINPPQVAILAVGEVSPRPVVSEDGKLVARKCVEVALSVDHRVVYGAEAARFLQRLKFLLERPVSLVTG